jgi:hypothetical protein
MLVDEALLPKGTHWRIDVNHAQQPWTVGFWRSSLSGPTS